MPGKKGTKRAPDGSYVPVEEAKRLWAEENKKQSDKDKPKKAEVVGSGEQRKLEPGKKKKAKDTTPRLTLTEYDEKGRQVKTTFVCDPESLHIHRDENITYTAGGRPKKTLSLTIDADILEIE